MEGCFGIGTAIAILRHGGKVARSSWFGSRFLELVNGRILIGPVSLGLWAATNEDLLADDYVEVE